MKDEKDGKKQDEREEREDYGWGKEKWKEGEGKDTKNEVGTTKGGWWESKEGEKEGGKRRDMNEVKEGEGKEKGAYQED